MDYKTLLQNPRLLLQAQLRPVQGDRFQPTGFADIGAAEYQRPDPDAKTGTQMLLVESAQSVANRLEKTCLAGDDPMLDPELEGLPYVVANLSGDGVGQLVTSSLVEAHRLGSPYFMKDKAFTERLTKEMNYQQKGQIDWKSVYKTFFKYDPNCLIHGVFLSLLEGGRVRVPRALTGFIEAEDVKPAQSGGVKNSPVDPKGEIQVESGGVEKGIYSNVPYARTEYVARNITAYFNLDIQQMQSYGLAEPGTELLIALALLKVRRFLDSDMRLRTACDFEVVGEVHATRPAGWVLPTGTDLLGDVKKLIAACEESFAKPAVTQNEVAVAVKKVAKQDKKASKEQSTTPQEETVES